MKQTTETGRAMKQEIPNQGFRGFQPTLHGVYFGERGMNVSRPFGFICTRGMSKGYVQAPLEHNELDLP